MPVHSSCVNCLAASIVGGYFIYKVPKEAFPGISLNQIVVVTRYPGASARDVELNVTAKIEEKLLEIGSIKEFRFPGG